jgi:PKD repeat protein
LSLVDRVGNIAKVSTAAFTVGSPPSAAFAVSPRSAATGVPVHFTSTSSETDAGVGITATAYEFGDGGTATTPTTSHVYTKPGTYTVAMAVVNSLGLISTTTHTIKIVKAKISKVRLVRVNSKGATIAVTVNAPGKLSGFGKSKTVSKPGTYKLKYKLKSSGHPKLKFKLKFKPVAGPVFSRKFTIQF